MGVQIDGATLERQLAERGRTKAELAAAANVHAATISHCIAGRPVAARTFRAIVAALHRMEPLPGADALLAAAATNNGTPRGPQALGVQATSTPDADGHPRA